MKLCLLWMGMMMVAASFAQTQTSPRTFSSPGEILERYSAEIIQNTFEETRGIFEFIESYDEKRNGIFIMSNRGLYQVRYREGTGLVFERIKTRREIDQEFSLWVLIWVCIIAGGAMLLVIFVPNRSN